MKLWREALAALVQGAKETPAGFFSPLTGWRRVRAAFAQGAKEPRAGLVSPAVRLWRALVAETDRAIAKRRQA